MSITNITDCDGTITTNSFEVYRNLPGISLEGDPKTVIFKYMKYMKNNGGVEKYLSLVKENLKYRKELIEYLKNKNQVYIISDNPFVKELIPPELRNCEGVYSTIVPEIVGGKFTGEILKDYTKVDIIKNHLPEPNGNKINFHTDGGLSDEELIKYLRDNYENVNVIRY
ncbi:MAG: hypothetical protein KAT28_01060 [Candidatus Aenigmarchaeota archaeon]|nr:hypothetical protein [Candidatus Aenigmarchaeota archaeon]